MYDIKNDFYLATCMKILFSENENKTYFLEKL